MIRWKTLVPTALIGLLLLGAVAKMPAAEAQDASRKVIYLYSLDFPPDAMVQTPSPALHETRFWRLMESEFAKTNDLALTQNLEEADYRVELRCGGIRKCSKLMVDIKNPQRDVLASFALKSIRPLLTPPNLEQVVHDLTERVDEKLYEMEQGRYGFTEYNSSKPQYR